MLDQRITQQNVGRGDESKIAREIAREKAAIEQAAYELSDQIEMLHTVLGTLEDKLAPVMGDDYPTKEDGVADREPTGSSPLYYTLLNQLERLRGATNRVVYARNRVEV
jgi:hypothetical protein